MAGTMFKATLGSIGRRNTSGAKQHCTHLTNVTAAAVRNLVGAEGTASELGEPSEASAGCKCTAISIAVSEASRALANSYEEMVSEQA
eukprot:scaffold238944_cov33-Tisochrysis_lutea.AAC.3